MKDFLFDPKTLLSDEETAAVKGGSNNQTTGDPDDVVEKSKG